MGGNQRPLLKLESCLPHLCGREVKVLASKSSLRSLPSKPCCWGSVIDDIPVNTGSHIINDNVWLSYFDITNNDRNKVLFQGFQNLFMKSKRSKRVLAPCKIFDVELDVPRSVATRTNAHWKCLFYNPPNVQCTFNTATSNIVCSVHNTVLSCGDNRTAHLYSRYAANTDRWCKSYMGSHSRNVLLLDK